MIPPEKNDGPEPENATLTLIDINTCSREELENLKGIGPETAENIIQGRPYGKIEDLDRVEDIGPKTLEEIRPSLTVSLIEHVNVPHLVSPREGATTPERDNNDIGVNINTCTLEELLAVPKVGARLVARIIDGRPYGRARDLLRVEGISESKLEVIRPYITIGADKAWRSVDEPPPSPPKKPKPPKPEKPKTSEEKPAETEPDGPATSAAVAASQVQTNEVREEPLPDKTPPEPEAMAEEEQRMVYMERRPGPSRAAVWLMGLMAVILAILLTLGIIWLINGSLRHATLDDLNQKIETLTIDTDALQTDMVDLQTTNTDLEERVAALEEQLSTTNEELTETTELAESLQALVDKDVDLQEQIDALEERVSILEETVVDLEEQLMALQTAGGTFEAPRPND